MPTKAKAIADFEAIDQHHKLAALHALMDLTELSRYEAYQLSYAQDWYTYNHRDV